MRLCGIGDSGVCRIGREEYEPPSIAARLLYANLDADPAEAWVRVSGEKEALAALEKVIRMHAGLAYQRLSETRHSMLLRLLAPKTLDCGDCTWCLQPPLPPGVMHVSTIVTPTRLYLELVAARRQAVEELAALGCEILHRSEAHPAAASLTSKQAYALVEAYLGGYYELPRRISLHELAARLGVTPAALAELLRRAEKTVIEEYVYRELPHLLIERLLMGRKTARG